MIDYTQLGFQDPVSVTDPLPTVADYLDNYRARNEAWYGQWAYPLGGGRFGARPESFQVRAPWTADLLPEETMPPILRETGGNLASPTGEEYGFGSTAQEDRPVGALVRDPAEMSNEDLWSEYQAYSDPMAAYAGSAPGAVVSVLAGAPTSLIGGLMARQGMENRATEVMNEMGRRMGALYPPQAQAALVTEGGGISGAAVPVQGGTRVFTGGDVLPMPQPIPLGSRYNEATGRYETYYSTPGAVGSGGYGGSSSDRDRGRDTYQGGEVGAGGWAGGGGL